jgi:hypothetical protein
MFKKYLITILSCVMMISSLTAMDKGQIKKPQDQNSTWLNIGAGFFGGAFCVGLRKILKEKTLKPFLKAVGNGSLFVVGVGGTGLSLHELKGKGELKEIKVSLKNDLKKELLNELRSPIKYSINYYKGEKTEDFDTDITLKDSNFSHKVAERLFNFVKEPIRALVVEKTDNELREFKEENPIYSYFVIGALPPQENQKVSMSPVLEPAGLFILGFTAQGFVEILKKKNPTRVFAEMGKYIIMGSSLAVGAGTALHYSKNSKVAKDFQKLLVKDVSQVMAQEVKAHLYPPVSWIIKTWPEEDAPTTNKKGKKQDQDSVCTIL